MRLAGADGRASRMARPLFEPGQMELDGVWLDGAERINIDDVWWRRLGKFLTDRHIACVHFLPMIT